MTRDSADDELRLLVQKISRRIRNNRGAQLSDSQLGVLFDLDLNGPMTPGRIATLEHVSPPSMNRTVNGLEDAGLVRREPDPTDGRRVLVTLQPAGAQLIRETRRLRSAWFSSRLRTLSSQERALLDAALPVLRKLAQE